MNDDLLIIFIFQLDVAKGKTQIAAVQLCKAFLVDTLGYTNKDFLVTANTSDQSSKLFGYVQKR